MKFCNPLNLSLALLLLSCSQLGAKDCHKAGSGNKYNVFGTGRLMLSQNAYDDAAAFGVLGEGGMSNSRLSGTFAFSLNCRESMKASFDYLTQELKYFDRRCRHKQWMNQVAGGGVYRHQFWHTFFKDLCFGGYYSNAKSKLLEHSKKRIDGSNYASGNVALGFRLWRGAEAAISGLYDHVEFRRSKGHKENISGFGYGLWFEQFLYRTFRLELKGELRRPYDFAEAKVKWSARTYAGLFTFGIFSNYTNGKKGIPTVTTAGIEIAWELGTYNPPVPDDCTSWCCAVPRGIDGRFDYSMPGLPLYLSSWANIPAVCLPVVISKIDK